MTIFRAKMAARTKTETNFVTRVGLLSEQEKVIRCNQSASKHGRRTFRYSVMRELVRKGQLWARAALRQLRSYKVG